MVAKSGGDFSDPVAALNSIDDASAANPYLVRIMPGVYEVGTESLLLKEYVDIEGSGVHVTVVSATPDSTVGVVQVPSYAEVRHLTVKHHHGAGIVSIGAYPKIRDVQILTDASPGGIDGVANFGMVLNYSSAAVEKVKIVSSGYPSAGTYDNLCVSITTNYGTTVPRFKDVEIEATGGWGIGVNISISPLPVVFENSKITTNGMAAAVQGGPLTLIRSRVEAQNGWAALQTVPDLVLRDSYVSNAGYYGVIDIANSVVVSNSEIVSKSGVPLFSRVGPVYVNNSKLDGPPVDGTVTKCISCFDGGYNPITVP